MFKVCYSKLQKCLTEINISEKKKSLSFIVKLLTEVGCIRKYFSKNSCGLVWKTNTLLN